MATGPGQSQLANEANLRPEIAVSWWRSELLGVRPELAIEAEKAAKVAPPRRATRRTA